MGMNQGSVLSLCLFAFMVNVVSGLAKADVLCELLYADDSVLKSDIIDRFKNKFIKCRRYLRARV